ncbi:MAG: hypothetical protein GX220_05590 [Treponema sp.]|jgi:NADH:ubiquinone oxidoreductase subunit E|nr:hypothetical protein [Treponema sp.]
MIKVSICTGTACFVMGASELLLMAEKLPANLQGKVEFEGITCLGKCKTTECDKAPFVLINGEVMQNASCVGLIEKLTQMVNE